MPDRRISSKRQSITGTLALRVLLVCLTFVFIPLLLYASLIYSQEPETVHKHLINLSLLILILGGGLTWLITWRMSKPLSHLSDTMDQVTNGNLQARYHQDRMGFEINALGGHFNN